MLSVTTISEIIPVTILYIPEFPVSTAIISETKLEKLRMTESTAMTMYAFPQPDVHSLVVQRRMYSLISRMITARTAQIMLAIVTVYGFEVSSPNMTGI